MVIGIDIRALQTGHKFRGIGEVAKQVTNRILKRAEKDGHSIIFYEYDYEEDPKDLLIIPKKLNYRVIKLGAMPERDLTRSLRQKIQHNLSQLFGNPIRGSEKSDVFIQYDYAFGVPKNTRTILIKHDLIPYVFWDNFFESAWVPFKNRALRTTLRTLFANYKYKRILSRSLKNAGLIISVSNSTKSDLKRFMGVSSERVKVTPLGVNIKPAKTAGTAEAYDVPTKPYLLFVGAGDERRRVADLVDAYNNLKADNYDIQLVLVGENFKKPELIPNKQTRDAVLKSSYKKDILTLGYVDDLAKQKLFKGAIAFVYPTLYEGFGIPILEAFLLGCRVITYRNSSIPEVGGNHAIYAKDWQDIVHATQQLLAEDKGAARAHKEKAKEYAEQFTWDKTAAGIYNEMMG